MFILNQINDISLIDLLLGKRTVKKSIQTKPYTTGRRDVLEISSAAKNMLAASKAQGTSKNRSVDKSIDLQSYIEKAKQANQSAIESAGSEIKANNADVYQDNYHAFKAALTEKYAKLADIAKSHVDPDSYIEQKYFDKTCSWYAGDLTDEERQIAFNYEKQMLNTGSIKGVKYKDSLFRGIEVNGGAVDAARTVFNRQMVNAQIGNILKNSNIEWDGDSRCTFSVDPYSYYISVEGVDGDKKQRMEAALNVGENGKNLYHHIKNCATQDGANSSRITEDGTLKYQAYQQIYDFTGLKLNELEERDGSYYTQDGQDVCDIVDSAIDNAERVPDSHKQQMKDWIREMVSRLSFKGWNHIADMFLEIDYVGRGLMDKHQDILFSLDNTELRNFLNSEKYITL